MNKKLRIKICGITHLSNLDACMGMGAHFCGFIFHPTSPRYISPSRVAALSTAHLKRVGVFVNQQQSEILNIMNEAHLDFAQLHGNQSIQCAQAIGATRVIRVLWPQDYPSIKALHDDMLAYADSCAWFLLDAGAIGNGGTGKTLDWNELATLNIPRPWFLAGGLSNHTIKDALNSCNPDGIDLNSGIEWAPGQKSPKDILAAMHIIQRQTHAPLTPSHTV
ncbi:MAG: phosphoribosylanthranilate isomerase [Akkermansia sp.]